MNRSEGKYNKQESSYKNQSDKPGFWKELFGTSSTNKEYTTNTRAKADSPVHTTPTKQDDDYDYIDFYTETSETDIYTKRFRSAESTDNDDNNDIGFYTETSELDLYTLIPNEEPAREYTTTPDDTTGTDHYTFFKLLYFSILVFIYILLMLIT